jgi:hypothetical protein
MVANFWRAIKHDPETTAKWADHPVFENDLHARHSWLLSQKENLVLRLEGDPDFYDPKIAGLWCWGICCWIGHGFCSGKGPWRSVDGKLVNDKKDGPGITRQLPHLRNAGRGVNRPGITRKLPHLRNAGRGVNRPTKSVYTWFADLAERFRNVRVCSGDWSRVVGPSPTFALALTGVFLDPPYSANAGYDDEVYSENSLTVAHEVRKWAIENGDNPLLRIALCGYEGEYEMPLTWEKVEWKAAGGYASQAKDQKEVLNKTRERIYFSPHCATRKQGRLF